MHKVRGETSLHIREGILEENVREPGLEGCDGVSGWRKERTGASGREECTGASHPDMLTKELPLSRKSSRGLKSSPQLLGRWDRSRVLLSLLCGAMLLSCIWWAHESVHPVWGQSFSI